MTSRRPRCVDWPMSGIEAGRPAESRHRGPLSTRTCQKRTPKLQHCILLLKPFPPPPPDVEVSRKLPPESKSNTTYDKYTSCGRNLPHVRSITCALTLPRDAKATSRWRHSPHRPGPRAVLATRARRGGKKRRRLRRRCRLGGQTRLEGPLGWQSGQGRGHGHRRATRHNSARPPARPATKQPFPVIAPRAFPQYVLAPVAHLGCHAGVACFGGPHCCDVA